TLYGDLDVSLIKDRPPGRMPIQTRVINEKERDHAYAFLADQLAQGRQAYVVYPLVEESEKVDLRDAESGYQALQQHFGPDRVGLVHGKMRAADKDAVMGRFKAGE